MMHEPEKSDSVVVTKPTNKAERSAAESVEPRTGTEGNAGQQSACRATGPGKRVTVPRARRGTLANSNKLVAFLLPIGRPVHPGRRGRVRLFLRSPLFHSAKECFKSVLAPPASQLQRFVLLTEVHARTDDLPPRPEDGRKACEQGNHICRFHYPMPYSSFGTSFG